MITPSIGIKETKKRFDGGAEHSDAILEFSMRLPLEFCVMLIKDCTLKHEEITTADRFDEWIVEYGNYLF